MPPVGNVMVTDIVGATVESAVVAYAAFGVDANEEIVSGAAEDVVDELAQLLLELGVVWDDDENVPDVDTVVELKLEVDVKL